MLMSSIRKTNVLKKTGDLPILDVINPLPEQGNDVVVLDGVVHFLPFAPGGHQVHLPKAAQVVGNR